MRTALDTSVMLDILGNDPVHAGPSEAALRKAARDGALVVCETVVAELGPVLGPDGVLQFLDEARILFVPTSLEAANHADRLLARDRRYYRDYFKGLHLWLPSAP
jgi:predicted nucleic acid-binding protein